MFSERIGRPQGVLAVQDDRSYSPFDYHFNLMPTPWRTVRQERLRPSKRVQCVSTAPSFRPASETPRRRTPRSSAPWDEVRRLAADDHEVPAPGAHAVQQWSWASSGVGQSYVCDIHRLALVQSDAKIA